MNVCFRVSVFWGAFSHFLWWGHLCYHHVVPEVVGAISASLASWFLRDTFWDLWAVFSSACSVCGYSLSLVPAFRCCSLPLSSCCCLLSSASDSDGMVFPSIHCLSSSLAFVWRNVTTSFFSSFVRGWSTPRVVSLCFHRAFPAFVFDWSLHFVVVFCRFVRALQFRWIWLIFDRWHLSTFRHFRVVWHFVRLFPSWTAWCLLLSQVSFWDHWSLGTSRWKGCYDVIALLSQFSLRFL